MQSRPFRTTESYELRYPINVDGKTINAVELRWPSLSQFRRINRLPASAEHSLRFIAMATGLPRPAVEQLDVEDIVNLSDVLERFIGGKHVPK